MATHGFLSSGFFLLLLLLLLFQVLSSIVAADSFWTVKYLPGYSGPLPFELETGYVGVGDSEEVQLFYYFVKSQGNSKTDPLMTWLTGGPGCSAFCGFAFEIGPVNFKAEPYNESIPQLIYNTHTWAKKASILFIDSLVGTGFSYSQTLEGSKKGDFLQIKHLHQFLRKWLASHPEFTSNPFFVGGDSYSGMIVPPLTQAISEGNKQDYPIVINLKGYIVGNPVTDRITNDNSRIPYAYRMTLIPTELFKSLESNCDGEYGNLDPNNVECSNHVATFKKCVDRINYWCISCPYCKDVSSPQDKVEKRRSLYNTSQQVLLEARVLTPPSLDCQEYKYFLGYYWANNNQVRKALHVREGTIGEWIRCQSRSSYQYNLVSAVPYHANLSSKGYPSLVFSGDHDMIVPVINTEEWINSLNYSIVDDWRPWFNSEDQILGYTRTYANQMTFATIKAGGHTPEYMQSQAFVMFSRWIAGESL